MARTPLGVSLAVAAILGTACSRSPLAPQPGANSGVSRETPGYDVIDLGTLGGDRTLPAAINDSGIVVGSSQTADRRTLGFIYQKGVMRALRASQTVYDESADAINASGQIAGVVRDGRAVLRWDARTAASDVQTFPTPASPAPPPSRVVAIDAAGDMLVTLDDFVARAQGGVIRNGAWQDVGSLDVARAWTYPLAWNARGQIVGTSHVRHVAPTYEIFHPILWQSGVLKDLGVLGTVTCGDAQADCAGGDAVDINAQGTVVGTVTGAAGLDRAFSWQDGIMHDLGAFEGHSTRAMAINDRGQILFAVGVPDLGVFVWDNGSVQRVGPIGVSILARAFAEDGAVAGEMQQSDGGGGGGGGGVHAFVWNAGVLTDLGPGRATAINARGDIVGTDGGGLRGILWKKRN
ncbi:MAG TPA: hypothetical protein VG454_05295 [Gemmatimonadales bacterium]|nr:hypothetical protein [Gemmatimonadales bacterium]